MAYSECKYLNIREEGSIQILSFNRVESRNALNREMIQEIIRMLKSASENDLIRVLVLRAEGSVFCAGADLEWMLEGSRQSVDDNIMDAMLFYNLFMALVQFPKPLIAVVHGAVLGGAIGIAACADWVVAHPDCKFAFPETHRGIVPAMVMPFVWSKCESGIASFLMSGERFNVSEARRLMLIDDSNDEPLGKAISKARSFLSSAPNAVRVTKSLMAMMKNSGIPTRDEALIFAKAIANARTSDEGKEGLSAFLEKRPARWHVEK